MKKLLLLLCFILLFATVACANEPKVFSFRGVEFGMSRDAVKAVETAKFEEENQFGSFRYNVQEGTYGLQTVIWYSFGDIYNDYNSLRVISLYLLVPPGMDAEAKYAEIKANLWAKYNGDAKGEPLEDLDAWWFKTSESQIYTSIHLYDDVDNAYDAFGITTPLDNVEDYHMIAILFEIRL